MFMF